MPWQYYLKNAYFSLTCSVIMTRVLSGFFFGTGFPSVSIPFVSYNTDNHLFILTKIWIISLRTGWPVCRKHITEGKYSSMNQAILRCRLFRLCKSHYPCNSLPLPFHLLFYDQNVVWVAYSCNVCFFLPGFFSLLQLDLLSLRPVFRAKKKKIIPTYISGNSESWFQALFLIHREINLLFTRNITGPGNKMPILDPSLLFWSDIAFHWY